MFTDKVVIVTGASNGIGAATAIQFGKEGAYVVLVGRNRENLDRILSEFEGVRGEGFIIEADVTEENDLQKIVHGTITQFGKIDILINNAGILENGSIENTSLAQFDRVFNTNVRSMYYLTMLCVPHLKVTKGAIVNVSSVAGTRAFPNVLAYCMSKSAVDQFTKCVALELAQYSIRVNSVNPGVIITDIHKRSGMNEKNYQDFLEKSKSTHALGRAGTVEEVANTILFLASDAASFITAENLHIDGGRHAMCPR